MQPPPLLYCTSLLVAAGVCFGDAGLVKNFLHDNNLQSPYSKVGAVLVVLAALNYPFPIRLGMSTTTSSATR